MNILSKLFTTVAQVLRTPVSAPADNIGHRRYMRILIEQQREQTAPIAAKPACGPKSE